MRRLLCGLAIMMSCGAASAADIVVDTRPAFDALGLSDLQSALLPGISNVNLNVPLPDSVDGALPMVGIQGEDGLDIRPGMSQSFPELPGLGSLSELTADVELPGLDGLPIRMHAPSHHNGPQIPGIDGLPLGYGRR
mgnify:CR=1 FL=1